MTQGSVSSLVCSCLTPEAASPVPTPASSQPQLSQGSSPDRCRAVGCSQDSGFPSSPTYKPQVLSALLGLDPLCHHCCPSGAPPLLRGFLVLLLPFTPTPFSTNALRVQLMGLEECLSSRVCTALPEDRVHFPTPTSGGSQLPVTSAPGDLMPLQAPALTYTDTDIITGCRQSKACIQSGHGCAPEHCFLRAVK